MSRLRDLLDKITHSLWFVPLTCSIAAFLISWGTLALDHQIEGSERAVLGWTYTGGAGGARTLLSAIAGAMVTVLGITVSTSIAALTMASGQFGPRLLRLFVKDKGIQIVLGLLVGIALYCLLILRTVGESAPGAFVPDISVRVAVGGAVVAMAALIYFIHHAAALIHVQNIIAAVSEDLDAAITRLCPDSIGDAARLPEEIPAMAEDATVLFSSSSGYMSTVDHPALVKAAAADGLVLHLLHKPGHFVPLSAPLARVSPAPEDAEALTKTVNAAVTLSAHRSGHQGLEFLIEELVEVALRALSPGINDPFSAIACLDRLGSALGRLAVREFPSSLHRDDEDTVRVVQPLTDFPGMLNCGLNQIRQYGRSSVAVTVRLLEIVDIIAHRAVRPADRADLRRHAAMLLRSADGFPEPDDHRDVRERYAEVMRTLAD